MKNEHLYIFTIFNKENHMNNPQYTKIFNGTIQEQKQKINILIGSKLKNQCHLVLVYILQSGYIVSCV